MIVSYSSTHWLHPKCQEVPSLLSSRHFFTMHSTGTCTRMYTITYEKATFPSTRVELASTHIRMWVGFNPGSTQIHRKRVQCRHAQPEFNPGSSCSADVPKFPPPESNPTFTKSYMKPCLVSFYLSINYIISIVLCVVKN